MQFSVVMPTWNRVADLRDAAASILKQKGAEFELIIIDNGSKDDTEAYCRELSRRDRRVRYFRYPRNMGITVAENKGLKEAHGDMIFCFDDDQYLEDDDVFLRVLQLDKEFKWDILNVALVNSYTKEYDDYHIYAQRRKRDLRAHFYASNFCNGTVFIKKQVFDRIGYFEEFYFRQIQENEFALRAILAGFDLLYYPKLVIQHKCNPYRPAQSEVSYYAFRNVLLKNYKFFSGWRLLLLQIWQFAQFLARTVFGKITPQLFVKALCDYQKLKPQVQRILDYDPAIMRRYFFLSRRMATRPEEIGQLNFLQYYLEGAVRFLT